MGKPERFYKVIGNEVITREGTEGFCIIKNPDEEKEKEVGKRKGKRNQEKKWEGEVEWSLPYRIKKGFITKFLETRKAPDLAVYPHNKSLCKDTNEVAIPGTRSTATLMMRIWNIITYKYRRSSLKVSWLTT